MEPERGAPVRLTMEGDIPAHFVDQFLRNDQAQTGTAGSLAAALIHTIEALKHAGLCFFRDADAVIGHSQGAVSVAAAGCGDLYLTAGTIIADRIIAQVLA